MLIGVPKEVKSHEYRVGLVPGSVRELVHHGHKVVVETGAGTGIAYETVTDRAGGLPLLAPMSEVAGRMSVQVGAHCLEKEQGGLGILLGGVPGVAAAKVVILGGGVSGTNAARVAMGMEAHVTVIDRSLPRLYELDM